MCSLRRDFVIVFAQEPYYKLVKQSRRPLTVRTLSVMCRTTLELELAMYACRADSMISASMGLCEV